MFSKVLVSSLCFALALSKPLARDMRVHEHREGAPAGFTLHAPAPHQSMLDLRIALVQSDPHGLEEALYDVSTPGNAKYGQHLTKEQAADYAAPSASSVGRVNSWLASYNLTATTMTTAGDWLSIRVSVGKANEMFDTTFQVFNQSATGRQTIRALQYSIPADMSDDIDLVHPTIAFPVTSIIEPRVHAVNISARAANIDSSCNDMVTPSCLQSLYNIPSTPATQSSNTLGVTGYSSQYPQKADLKDFLQQFRADISPETSFALSKLDGGSDPQNPNDAGVEADLDIEYTVGLATGVPVNFLTVGDNNHDGDLSGWLDTVNYLLGLDSPPPVVTTSYGANEEDIPRKLAIKYCNAVAQLGTRGISFLFASGDGGVSGGQSQGCKHFVPVFPAECPFITSVGATQGVPETAAYFSSGGFSNYFGRPPYQSSVVETYLEGLGSTYKGLYNASGRGFPDVATQGVNFGIVAGGQTQGVDGTSCASPTFASIIALLNDQLVAAGKSPLGFLNPWLYANGDAFNNITSGSNPGCGTNGFSAAAGWSPVTGLGTPDFNKLLTAAGL